MSPAPGPPGEHGPPALTAAVRAAIGEGVRHFDAGEFWHAHESWERAWHQERGHDRHFLKGLIQYAAALHHWRRGSPGPSARLLSQARTYLASHGGPRWPFSVHALLAGLEQCQQRLAQVTPAACPQPLLGFIADHAS